MSKQHSTTTGYKVGKIRADDIPDGKIISTIGSKADMSSVRFSISSEGENVNNENSLSSEGRRLCRMQADGEFGENKIVLISQPNGCALRTMDSPTG